MTYIINQKEVLDLLMDHAGIIHKLSYMYSNNKEEYNDLRQEVYYQLLKSYPRFNGQSKLSTWVYKVALFTALSFLRSKRKTSQLLEDLPEIIVESPETDRLNEVMDQVKKLPKLDRSLVLLYLEDKSYKEMAEIMGLSESNIGVKLNRIKKKLREKLER